MTLAALVGGTAGGCGIGDDPTKPRPRPDIELIDQPAPPLAETTEYTEGRPTRLLASLPLHEGRGLYLGEWPSLPVSQTTMCYFAFESDYPEPDVADPENTFCDDLARPVHLWERGEHARWPDVTFGTIDVSIDEVRLTFEGACGTQTYEARGPLLRSYPKRRVFMLDQSDSCLWKMAEALRDGTVVATYEKPAAPRD